MILVNIYNVPMFIVYILCIKIKQIHHGLSIDISIQINDLLI